MGRSAELAELGAALEDARSGSGRLVLVSGAPGIGKSRIASELGRKAADSGARVLWGGCREAEGAPAYWPWTQIFRSCLRGSDPAVLADLGASSWYLGQIVPEVRARVPERDPSEGPPPDSDSARFFLFDSATTLLRGLSEREPLVLLLDDLHWADRPSLLLLQFLARELRGMHVLTIGLYRGAGPWETSEASALLAELRRDGRLLSLAGLSRDEVRQLVEIRAGSPPPESVVTMFYDATEGNPFFVDELARLWIEEGQPSGASPLRLGLPEGARQLLRRRLAPLPEDGRELLSTAAVIGRTFELRILKEVSGLDGERLANLIDASVSFGLVHETPRVLGGYGFSHALIRETLYGDLPVARRLEVHHRVAEVLQRRFRLDPEAHVEEIAHHFCQAASGGPSEDAFEHSRIAGERAMARLAYEEAVRHYRNALQALAPGTPDDDRRLETLLALGNAERGAGDTSGAARSLDRAVALAGNVGPPERFARAVLEMSAVHGAIAETYDPSGKIDETLISLLERALTVLGPEESGIRARLLGRLATALYWAPDSRERREALSRDAVAMAERSGDPAALAAVLKSRRYALWGPDDLEERLATANEVLRLADASGDPERALQAHEWKLWDLLELGDIQAADLEIELHARLADRLRQPFYLGYTAMLRAMRAFLEGRFAEGQRLAEEALALGQRAQNPSAPSLFGAQLFWAQWAQGRLPMLEAVVAGIQDRQAGIPSARAALALVYSELGRGNDARAAFEHFAAAEFRNLPKNIAWLMAMAALSLACVWLGDRERAVILYRMLRPYSGRNIMIGPPPASSFGPVDYYLGRLAALADRRKDARAHYEKALRMARAMGARPSAALVERAYAETLLAGGEASRALELATGAGSTAEELGMAALADEARQLKERCEASGRALGGASASAPTAVREGDYWTLGFAGRQVRIPDGKGVRYLVHLLARPGEEVHVSELAGAGESGDVVERDSFSTQSRGEEPRVTIGLGDAGDVLDERAEGEYRRRLGELRRAREAAAESADRQHLARIDEEIRFLDRELAAAFGLGGRSRKAADTAERTRKAVANRVRDAMARLEREHPGLGRHLAAAIRTGVYCCYAPPAQMVQESGLPRV